MKFYQNKGGYIFITRNVNYGELGCALIALSKDGLHNKNLDGLSLLDMVNFLLNKNGVVRFCEKGLILNPDIK